MPKANQLRLAALEKIAAAGPLAAKDATRLAALRAKLALQQEHELPCPFKINSPHPTCSKPGGVCSIRPYTEESGGVRPVDGKRGRVRALCPWRFHQDGTAFDKIGEHLLSDPKPRRSGEVGFLESTGNLDSDAGEDVGPDRHDLGQVKQCRRGNDGMGRGRGAGGLFFRQKDEY